MYSLTYSLNNPIEEDNGLILSLVLNLVYFMSQQLMHRINHAVAVPGDDTEALSDLRAELLREEPDRTDHHQRLWAVPTAAL